MHQIASFKPAFSKKTPTSEGGTSPLRHPPALRKHGSRRWCTILYFPPPPENLAPPLWKSFRRLWWELANTVFKIQPNKANSFFCFLMFVQSFNCLYLWNQFPNLCGAFTKLKPKQYPNKQCQKTKNHIFWHQTHFAWSHHKFTLCKQNKYDNI